MKEEMLIIFVGVFLLICSSMAMAANVPNLKIEKIPLTNTIVKELNSSATYILNIQNNGEGDHFEIYSFVGFNMAPKNKFFISKGGNVTLDVIATPSTQIRAKYDDYLSFEYQIIGDNSGVLKDKLFVKLVSLKDIITMSGKLSPSDDSVVLFVKNRENVSLNNLDVNFDSLFFSEEKTVSLGPEEGINLTFSVNKNKTAKLKAGSYVVIGDVAGPERNVELSGVINYLENQSLSVSYKRSGFLIVSNTVTKTNEGNLPATAQIMTRKNIFTRLFTTYSVDPISIERKGLSVDYTWERPLLPSESFEVTYTTNYTFPVIIVVLIIVIAFLAKIYSTTSVSVNKKVSFVRTKGGEFALKVTVNVKARKNVDNVKLTDRIPSVSKIYEHFVKAPDNINHATNSLSWNIGSLNAGEERVFSYIIYNQKLKVVGRYELPRAHLSFTHKGTPKSVLSNRTFFLSETARGEQY